MRNDQELPYGLYELVKSEKTLALPIPEGAQWQENTLSAEDAAHVHSLTRYVAEQVGRRLEQAKPQERLALVNTLLGQLDGELGADSLVAADGGDLLQLTELKPQGKVKAASRPSTPLSEVALLTNNPKEPKLGEEIQRELESADRVDLLCSFLKLAGVNILGKQLEYLKSRGIPFRVLTTTYMGATERKAVDALVKKYGAEVKISYEKNSTRLHAKAWIFHRDSGFTTGYVGSSNLSHAALTEGLEWNVRVSHAVTPGILSQFDAAFQSYWESAVFESYTASPEDQQKLDDALGKATVGRGVGRRPNFSINFSHIDVNPYPHQALMLDELQAERQKGHHRNLVVAATGTGKTIFSALDYRRLCERYGRRLRLLFVAHQGELLVQAQRAFATVMRSENFGEHLWGGQRPLLGEHVFATVQSLAQGAMGDYEPDHFDVVVVDEFHHAEAKTYRKVLDYFNPAELLGLTATPERADGKNVASEFFEGRIATQLRLWDALEADLLVPFHYYGLDDGTDLRGIRFQGGRYGEEELARYYLANRQRLRIILQQLEDKVADVQGMRAIGFCVNVAHARFMAEEFNKASISAAYLTGESSEEERRSVIERLKDPGDELCIVFTVNLFNEGVDIPEVDTLLMLRPTQSPTLFQQQLGRGLRRSPDKAVLVVLDFVGTQARGFRFDLKMRSFTRSGNITEGDITHPNLPAGCNIQLDRLAQEQVLKSIRETLKPKVSVLVDRVKVFAAEQKRQKGEVMVAGLLEPYLEEYGLGLEHIYGRKTPQGRGLTFTFLLDQAGLLPVRLDQSQQAKAAYIAHRLKALVHVNDSERVDSYTRLLTTGICEREMSLAQRRMAWMLLFSIWPSGKFEKGEGSPKFSLDEGLAELRGHTCYIQELIQIWAYRLERDRHLPQAIASLGVDVPLKTHAYYTREEIFAALGKHEDANRPSPGGQVRGVLEAPQANALALTVTLNKSERHYSPETMYRDYAITEGEFAWDSQNTTTPQSRLGQIYQHRAGGEVPLLFVRYNKQDDIGTAPFLCVGPVFYRSHTGSRPMHITWGLEREMPADLYNLARAVS